MVPDMQDGTRGASAGGAGTSPTTNLNITSLKVV